MFDTSWLTDWMQGGPNKQQMGANPMAVPSLIPQPINPMANMMMPGANLGTKNPGAVPAYAQSQPGFAGAQGMAGSAQAASPPGAGPNDNLRKMLMMQAMMGGDEQVQGPNGALPSGAGMRGTGGAQVDPNVGMLNSFPHQLPPRKRFIGMSGG